MKMVEVDFVWLNSVHDPDFVYYDDTHDWWLLVQTKAPVKLHVNVVGENGQPIKEDIEVPPDTVMLYPPRLAASYEAAGVEYANYYVRFYTDEDFIDKLKIPYGRPVPLNAPESMDCLFKVLEKEFFSDYAYRLQSMGQVIRLMLMKIAESVEDSSMSEQQRELINLRYDIQTRPDYQWTVKEMSERVHISVGYLQSIYKKQFGVSCMQDVLNRRVDLAKEYLSSSVYSSQKIAQLCGYQSIEHFCRQFKIIEGISPLQYRKQQQLKKSRLSEQNAEAAKTEETSEKSVKKAEE